MLRNGLWIFLICSYVSSSFAHPPQSTKPTEDKLSLNEFPPYFTSGVANKARVAIREGRFTDAITLFNRYLQQKQIDDRPQAEFLLAHALYQVGEYDDAMRIYLELIARYPLLEPYHRLYAARCAAKVGKNKDALELLAAIPEMPALKDEVLFQMATVQNAIGESDRAVELWQRYLAEVPNGVHTWEVHVRLAQAYKGSARPELQVKAIEHYKEVIALAPSWPQRKEVETTLRELTSRLPKALSVEQTRSLAEFSAQQELREIMIVFRAMQNERAETLLGKYLRRTDLTPLQKCQAHTYRAKAVFQQRQAARAEPLFAAAETACRAVSDEESIAGSMYNRARCLFRKQSYEAAATLFLKLEQEFPTNSLADDARLRAAEAYEELGNKTQVVALLAELPKRHPKGDQLHEALWRLARQAYFVRDYSTAIRYLDESLKLGRAPIYYQEGLAHYWKARVLEIQKKAEAWDNYQRCIEEYPLSYYALLAFNRLKEGNSRLFNKLWKKYILPISHSSGHVSFSWGALRAQSPFQRGVELLRLGFTASGTDELSQSGLKLAKDTREKYLWILAGLLDRSELWHLSHHIPRVHDIAFKLDYPHGEQYFKWAIAYPQAFAKWVRLYSEKQHLPPALTWAIMREESGFLPTIESWANAIGLMQMILPTAKTAAAFHRQKATPTNLRDPETNIKFGTTFLGWLYNKAFAQFAPFAVASYNAGEGAIYRWLDNDLKGLMLDEFVEKIPYDQTRNYTKRVLSSYFAYSVLYGKAMLPHLPLNIPTIARNGFAAPSVPKTAKQKAKSRTTSRSRR